MSGPRRRALRRSLLGLVVLAAVLVLATLVSWLWLRGRVRASLPQLEGELAVSGLWAPVTIERDRLGVPTLHAGAPEDLALATGFVHAQDRFFQMDLLRRSAAGELAELLGPGLLPVDRQVRVHRFRSRARVMFEASTPAGRRILESYTRGVNAGLGSLGHAPFEYVLLRTDPLPWRPEDSTLVLLAMFLDLQDETGSYESMLGLMREVLPEGLYEFLAPAGTEWDAPLMGGPYGNPPVPGPEVVDIRSMEAWQGLRSPAGSEGTEAALASVGDPWSGSNNWAVAAGRTSHGGAILANDMHLGIRLPNIWYRAKFVWREGDEDHFVTGVTLPGTPGMAVGSNGRIAWGYTNSYLDWSDLVVLEADPEDDRRYRTPDGPRPFERHDEVLRVNTCAARIVCAGVEEGETLEVRETIWGPVVDTDHRGRRRAIRWVAHHTDAVNLGLMAMATAGDLDEGIATAQRAGIPGQNVVIADAGGRIGWTIMGIMPRRVGFDGRLPASWADGTRRWDGWLEPREYPEVVDPRSGRIWTANSRVVDAAWADRVGDGGYPLGARARQIREDLFAVERASERDLLDVQLDDRAVFLERWRAMLLELLDPEAVAGDERRAEFRHLVEETWTGRASVDSVAYRLVRAFRIYTSEKVFEALTFPCRQVDRRFVYFHRQAEGPLWRLVSERPRHLLHPAFASWEDWLLSVVDFTIDYYLQREGSTLAERSWGQRNNVRIAHPLSLALPRLGRWLDAPREPLPGDSYMPRVQGVMSGASQRMVVSPGREAQGIFHMPGGQSGHPMSPHYLDGHSAWAEGRPTPLSPGPPVHRLTLSP